jgi:hypothetical protein
MGMYSAWAIWHGVEQKKDVEWERGHRPCPVWVVCGVYTYIVHRMGFIVYRMVYGIWIWDGVGSGQISQQPTANKAPAPAPAQTNCLTRISNLPRAALLLLLATCAPSVAPSA